MFRFGVASENKLATAHPDLVRVFRKALQLSPYDFTIVWAYRTPDEQRAAFASGNSRKRPGESKHEHLGDNGKPQSLAIDFAPWTKMPDGKYGIAWSDTHAFAVIGGIILAAAALEGVRVRYGGDWDMDGQTTDQTLMDWGHVELVN